MYIYIYLIYIYHIYNSYIYIYISLYFGYINPLSRDWRPSPSTPKNSPGVFPHENCVPRGPDSLISDCMCCWIASQQRGDKTAVFRSPTTTCVMEEDNRREPFFKMFFLASAYIHMISISQILGSQTYGLVVLSSDSQIWIKFRRCQSWLRSHESPTAPCRLKSARSLWLPLMAFLMVFSSICRCLSGSTWINRGNNIPHGISWVTSWGTWHRTLFSTWMTYDTTLRNHPDWTM